MPAAMDMYSSLQRRTASEWVSCHRQWLRTDREIAIIQHYFLGLAW